MQRVDFKIYDELGKLIDEAVRKYGFSSRADFFRYLAIDFIRHEKPGDPDRVGIKSAQGRNFI